jgi:hypothetical protein
VDRCPACASHKPSTRNLDTLQRTPRAVVARHVGGGTDRNRECASQKSSTRNLRLPHLVPSDLRARQYPEPSQGHASSRQVVGVPKGADGLGGGGVWNTHRPVAVGGARQGAPDAVTPEQAPMRVYAAAVLRYTRCDMGRARAKRDRRGMGIE